MESILLIFIALGEYLVHFPQGLKLWFGSCLGESHNILYKMNHDAYEILKIPPHSSHTYFHQFEWLWDHLRSHFRQLPKGNWSPSKDSYFEHNIKKVWRSNWGVIKHPWTSYLSYNIIHVPSKKIWEHLGQSRGLDIKTS